MNKKLRVGLLINQFHQPAWIKQMVEKIIGSNYAEIVLVVKSVKETNQQSSRWNQKLFSLYNKFDKRIFKIGNNAFHLKDISNLLKCQVVEINNNNDFSNESIQKIKSYDIDVLVNLSSSAPKNEFFNCSKNGIWSFYQKNKQPYNEDIVGIWEVFNKEDTTEVNLLMQKDYFKSKKILFKSFSSTDKLSINRNKNTAYWKAASFLPRKLNELFTQGEKAFLKQVKTDNSIPNFNYNQLLKTPNSYEVFKGFIKMTFRIFDSKILSRFYLKQWILLFKIDSRNEISKSFSEFKRMTPPKDRFWADPFVIERDDHYYIFLEELYYSENKGKISVITMDKKGNYDSPKVILEKDYHLSYPFLLEEGDDVYMIPETFDNSTIELYKCTKFPYEWEFSKNLMSNIKAVDATILKRDGIYWLFANIRENEGASNLDELFLYYSEDLFSNDWVSHPKNPIVSDVRSSRPAGKIFSYENRMFRPSQNCSKHYGYGMKINEILVLNQEDYQEIIVESIYPNWSKDLVSTHTINNYNQITIIDAIIKRRK